MRQYTREELFATAPIGRTIRELAMPTIAGQLITMIYNMTDTYFVGKTGDPLQVAAVSIAFPIYHLLNAMANMYGMGGGIMISSLIGRGEHGRIGQVCSMSFWSSVISAGIFSLILYLFMEPIMRIAGASDDTLAHCSNYTLWVLVIGGIPTMISLVMTHLIRSDGHGKEAGAGMVIGGISNIILDPIFVCLLHMGVVGAAVATFISNIISCFYYIAVLLRMGNSTLLTLNPSHVHPSTAPFGKMLRLGAPSALYVITSSLSNVVFNKLLSGYGDITVAAAGVAKKLDTLPLMVCMGISQGVVPVLAYNYAAKNSTRLRQVFRYALAMGTVMCFLCVAVYFAATTQIIRFFIDNDETIVQGGLFLRLLIAATPLMNINIMTNSLFQAAGKSKQSILLSLFRQGLLYIPIMFMLSSAFGSTGIVAAQILADGLTMIFSFIMYRRCICVENQI